MIAGAVAAADQERRMGYGDRLLRTVGEHDLQESLMFRGMLKSWESEWRYVKHPARFLQQHQF